MSDEITNHLIAANRSYFGLKCQFKLQLLSRKTKILICKTLVRPLLTYAAGTWIITINEERTLSILERKILHRINVQYVRERAVAEGDREIKELYSELNIVNIK